MMHPFEYQRAESTDAAVHALPSAHNRNGAKLIGGGTNLVDLMKDGVERPSKLIDITHLDMTSVTEMPDGGVRAGALVRNSDLANHPLIRSRYPLLSQALLSGASPQLRNMATTGGNLMQRTRCYYFMDTAFSACNKREPGSGCAAIKGENRIHAVLGVNQHADEKHICIATHPSDMCVALAALKANVQVMGPKGKRSIPVREFHRLPGTTPGMDTNLASDELITSVDLGPSQLAAHSHYMKVRDRQSYAFALVSVAAGLEMDGQTIRSAHIALGGLAHKPWTSAEAENALAGKPATEEYFQRAAGILMAGAKSHEHNTFKIELAKQAIVRTLTLTSRGGVA
jgi:xanthine dehydrogenase YagS FAD-binding subunit